MSLLVSPGQFAGSSDSLDGTAPTNLPGVAFTAGANNSDGSPVTVLPALAHDVHRLEIMLAGINAAGVAAHALADVLVDPAGGTSWSALIDYLACGFTITPATGNPTYLKYVFPRLVRAGSSIGLRARTSHTSDITTGLVVMHAAGNWSLPGTRWVGQKTETLGVTAASSSGTPVTPSNGSWGTWTNVGAPISARYGSIQIGFNGSDATAANIRYHFQIGYSSVKLPGSPTIHYQLTTGESGAAGPGHGQPIECDIPEGTQLQVRAWSNGAPEIIQVALYGTY